ncbi:Serine/threonine-protein kinase PrkC [Rubripirellula lacrimiformis]|uniref:Serine/threonine-protein kinase PrkC n=1 Tax=Rubripirellula lacrimiformis TaxID=1930273 RepID=A0A517NE19_9BACT|nr:protein kinase [Rubripirellula lacrimiformis]QDT05308.1 Serine/threonine-protein kinase PrkC [Rubripirellula lacrimiformis]
MNLLPDHSSHPHTRALQATRVFDHALIDRLRATGKFNDEQLKLVHEELVQFVQHTADDWSFLDLPKGTTVGEYELAELLGQGGSGQVYRAFHPGREEESVALKLVKKTRSTDRFRREMELVQRLAHPNVVVSYEVGELRGVLYIVMEKLEGPDLHQHVRTSGPIPWQDTIELMLDAAHGLQHAHHRGLIHRDVKPGNLMFDGGKIKVTDLGLAVLTEEPAPDSHTKFHTRLEMIGGTPEFMAPEQARSLGAATHQSDIYALGSTWFFLLTGISRVSGESMNDQITNLIRNLNIRKLPSSEFPTDLANIIDRMTAHRAEDRYESMADVATAIQSMRLIQADTSKRRGVRIMVVEDDRDDLYLTVEMLRRANQSVSVSEAHSLAEAIEATRQADSIDVLLLDLRLPDSVGMETVIRARDALPGIPIIVLTGQDDVAVGEACIAAGADDFASKNDLNAHLLERLIFVTLSRFKHNRAGYQPTPPAVLDGAPPSTSQD